MNNSPTFRIVITDYFKKQLKSLIKKDAKLIKNLEEELINFSKQKAIFIKSKIYKIRIGSQNKGKSGGYRAYLLLLEINNILAPVCIYSKKEKTNLSYEELAYSLEKTTSELENFL